MKKFLLLAAVLVAGCTAQNTAKRVLAQQGYSDVRITGYRLFMCAESDDFSTGFEATSPSGVRVTGAVCSGWLKGATVRFD